MIDIFKLSSSTTTTLMSLNLNLDNINSLIIFYLLN